VDRVEQRLGVGDVDLPPARVVARASRWRCQPAAVVRSWVGEGRVLVKWRTVWSPADSSSQVRVVGVPGSVVPVMPQMAEISRKRGGSSLEMAPSRVAALPSASVLRQRRVKRPPSVSSRSVSPHHRRSWAGSVRASQTRSIGWGRRRTKRIWAEPSRACSTMPSARGGQP
jgi:hypothetical protein